jgi:putative oxidoreductase
MKYAVWFVRLLFASWMIPAGVNHFFRIFPQPMGSQPHSQELIRALIDSHLFDIVKFVELIAGLSLLTGFYTSLALLLCMPISFCVFYWDAPLEGWGSRAARFGYAVLLCNVLLCVAYIRSYLPMFATGTRTRLLLAGRLVFGAWMLANGINHFFFPLWPEPVGHEPLAMQLMAALVHSQLFDVAMAIQLVAGALILGGILVPVALCVVMPVTTCALYWSVILEHRPLGTVLALAAFALNGLLMLGNLDYYKSVLQRYAPMLGEGSSGGNVFEAVYVHVRGRTTRNQFVPALITLVAVAAFYVYMVTGRTSKWCLLVLLVPGIILLARRLRDMGRSVWLLLVPGGLMLAAFTIWLGFVGPDAPLASILPLTALAASAAIALWGCVGKGKAT